MSLTSLYVSLTGLLSFSRGLDVVSDNVANLNTAGFRATDLFFRDLGVPADVSASREAPGSLLGYGSTAEPRGRRLTTGEIRSTGVVGNLAINGAGFFAVRTDEGFLYTRAGQFEIRPSGFLIDPATGGRLQAVEGGTFADLRVELSRTSAAVPSTRIGFRGVLSTDNSEQRVQNIGVIDADGAQRTLTLTLSNAGAEPATGQRVWNLSIADDRSNTIAGAAIRFDTSGMPMPGFSESVFDLAAASGKTSRIALNFGSPGVSDGVTSLPNGTDAAVVVSEADGRALGTLAEFSFGTNGVVEYRFSNGQTVSGPQVGLVNTPDPGALVSDNGTYFSVPDEARLAVGKPASTGFGSIVASSIELSNVELSREFADIVILQRGYQAASQVLNISSQLVEDLYSRGGAG